MQLQTHENGHISLPEAVMPLIHECAGEELFGPSDSRIETLKTLAFNFLLVRQRPTRIVFHTVSDVLGIAREQGFSDNKINAFLASLEKLLDEQ